MKSYTIELQRSSLPFTPSSEQAIYIEPTYDDQINSHIKRNYAEICSFLHNNRMDFCYLPMRCAERSAELLKYHNPCSKGEVESVFTTAEFVNVLFGGKVPADFKPSLIIYNKYRSTPAVCSFFLVEFNRNIFGKDKPWWRKMFDFNSSNRRKLSEMKQMAMALERVNSYYANNPDTGLRFSFLNWYDDEYWEVKKQHHQLIAEIDLRIHQLQERGVDALILKKMLAAMVDEHRPLSKLTITKDLRIVLNDYECMEIRMEPINKAVFLLFLNHEEGIPLKCLSDYRSELESYYTRLSHDDIEKRKKAIEMLIDPANNSIHEKLSRIRQAFIAKFEEDLAENYFITGARGEAKRIALPREMVTWE
ncbi:MAG: hypothetical protein ACI30R_04860 [Sodaliphilus sp.]